jgi:hypothetical protein
LLQDQKFESCLLGCTAIPNREVQGFTGKSL